MPLNFSLAKVANWRTLCYEKFPGQADDTQLKLRTEILIKMMEPVGFSNINEANYKEVFSRLWMLERLYGTFVGTPRLGQNTSEPFTLGDIKAHIGLSTNCATLTNAQFWKRFRERIQLKLQEELGE